MSRQHVARVVVVGAGVIGTAIAWRLAQRDLDVTVLDPEPEHGAWHTAAGMLAPITELQYTETPLLRLNLASVARWPDFAAEVEDESGTSINFRRTGTVLAAWDAADLAGLRDLHAFIGRLGLEAALLTGRELRALEPAAAPGLPGGLHAPDDHCVDPRLLRAALVTAATRRGARFLPAAAERVSANAVQLGDGSRVAADRVVVAAGAWSGRLAGLAVRPVKGQTIRLTLPGDPLQGVLRGRVRGNPVYLVPRGDGRVVVGASTEEAGFDRTPRAGAVYELLRDAQALLPEVAEARLDEVCTGLRPGSPDNAPLIGESGGVVHATGHYRNGVLLAPVTADAVADLVMGSETPRGFPAGAHPAGPEPTTGGETSRDVSRAAAR